MRDPQALARLRELARERRIGALDVESIGLPLFTIALGLVDGFNRAWH